MNSLSGLIYEDFVSHFMPKDIDDKKVSNILKVIVVTIGVVATCLIFVIQHLGGLFALGITLSGITAGPLLGLFTLGMVFPFANSKGALIGSATSLVLTSFIVIKNQIYKASGIIHYPPKPLSVDGCISNSTNFIVDTIPKTIQTSSEDVFVLFRITHYYNTFIGVMILLLVALPISWFTRKDEEVDVNLITPPMRWAVPKRHAQRKDAISMEELAQLNGKK
ncbi:sodium-coupled monocarboxylate transporter [Holotrichia oblita]|uniref:Sodium-coupled monocarboxylate transporter n=1 Tax=Holotrichia oblita TaxID=644536 RepID=A0ACB9TTS5_HOLOL|nr:sodium-coupled monocarboxylate transporter [Holotrichia oblita]